MSDQEVQLALTAGQVAQVLQLTGGAADGSPALLDPAGLVQSSALVADPRLSKSLLVGLAVLVSFSADGSLRRLTDVARELGLGTVTLHRYVQTLIAVGLLEQDPATRCYRRRVGGCV